MRQTVCIPLRPSVPVLWTLVNSSPLEHITLFAVGSSTSHNLLSLARPQNQFFLTASTCLFQVKLSSIHTPKHLTIWLLSSCLPFSFIYRLAWEWGYIHNPCVLLLPIKSKWVFFTFSCPPTLLHYPDRYPTPLPTHWHCLQVSSAYCLTWHC